MISKRESVIADGSANWGLNSIRPLSSCQGPWLTPLSRTPIYSSLEFCLCTSEMAKAFSYTTHTAAADLGTAKAFLCFFWIVGTRPSPLFYTKQVYRAAAPRSGWADRSMASSRWVRECLDCNHLHMVLSAQETPSNNTAQSSHSSPLTVVLSCFPGILPPQWLPFQPQLYPS